MSDKGMMPYMEAVTLEVMRFSSMVPFSIFHKTLADVEVGGYNIPKDTMVIPNLYDCHFDAEYWGDPQIFRPERFLSSDGRTVIRSERMVGFSLGKRICIGEKFARAEIFLFGTLLCQQFQFDFDPHNRTTSLNPREAMIRQPPMHKLIFRQRLH
jgi:cytochrome P450